MAGKDKAVSEGNNLVKAVRAMAESLNLRVEEQVHVARRIWGARRKIDLVLTNEATGKTLGIECKFQGGLGTAEEKVPATIQDIAAWPIPGIVVFSGEGFSDNMKSFLISTGKAVELNELEPWLRLYFGLRPQTKV